MWALNVILTLKIANHFSPHNTPAHTKFGYNKKTWAVQKISSGHYQSCQTDKRTWWFRYTVCVRACVCACMLDTLCELFHRRKLVMSSWLRQNLHKALLLLSDFAVLHSSHCVRFSVDCNLLNVLKFSLYLWDINRIKTGLRLKGKK